MDDLPPPAYTPAPGPSYPPPAGPSSSTYSPALQALSAERPQNYLQTLNRSGAFQVDLSLPRPPAHSLPPLDKGADERDRPNARFEAEGNVGLDIVLGVKGGSAEVGGKDDKKSFGGEKRARVELESEDGSLRVDCASNPDSTPLMLILESHAGTPGVSKSLSVALQPRFNGPLIIDYIEGSIWFSPAVAARFDTFEHDAPSRPKNLWTRLKDKHYKEYGRLKGFVGEWRGTSWETSPCDTDWSGDWCRIAAGFYGDAHVSLSGEVVSPGEWRKM